MLIEDRDQALEALSRLNYYRLSGYWYSARIIDPMSAEPTNQFKPGTSLKLCIDLYDFDARLRSAVLTCLAPIELSLRSLLGYHLGEIDPLIHLNSEQLSAEARSIRRNRQQSRTKHTIWLSKYNRAANASKEDFIEHHRERYGGALPVWVAVEIMDWGMLSHLYRFSPNQVRNKIGALCGITAPQLASVLNSLNILRNLSAHHARLFNRGYDMRPRQIGHELMEPFNSLTHRVFGQISVVRFLHHQLNLRGSDLLAQTLETFPHNEIIPFERTGAPENWQDLPLWAN